jgi:hypothetical protein
MSQCTDGSENIIIKKPLIIYGNTIICAKKPATTTKKCREQLIFHSDTVIQQCATVDSDCSDESEQSLITVSTVASFDSTDDVNTLLQNEIIRARVAYKLSVLSVSN